MSRHQSNDRSSDLTYIRGVGRDGQPTEFTNGLTLMPFANNAEHGGSVEVVHMLATVNSYDNSIRGPFKPIPLLKGQLPRLSRDGKRAYSGTFKKIDVNGNKKLVLSTREEDDGKTFYVHVHTGLNMDNRGSIEGDLNKLILENPDDFKVSTPGSFSLDGASVQLESAAGLEISEAQATRLRSSSSKTHGLIGAPGVRHDLWRIPEGAAVLVQDVTGIIFRIVNDKGELRLVDASKYAAVFNDLEMARRKTAAQARAAYHASRRGEKRSRGGIIMPDTSAAAEPAPTEATKVPVTSA